MTEERFNTLISLKQVLELIDALEDAMQHSKLPQGIADEQIKSLFKNDLDTLKLKYQKYFDEI